MGEKICADHDISSLTDEHCHEAHWLSPHHRIYDELAKKGQKYIAVCQKIITQDYIHLYGVYFSTCRELYGGPVMFLSILPIKISHSLLLTQLVHLISDYKGRTIRV